jgi:HEAT repeat protein
MTKPDPEQQLIRLASDNESIYQDAWQWFVSQGPLALSTLEQGLEDDGLGSVGHWRILLVLRQLALPSTLPAILKSFRLAQQRRDPIVLPGALEALAVIHTPEAFAALVSVLQSGTTDNVKHAAALFGQMGGVAAETALSGLLSHEQATVRKSAVEALLKINTATARQALTAHRRRETDPDILALINTKP